MSYIHYSSGVGNASIEGEEGEGEDGAGEGKGGIMEGWQGGGVERGHLGRDSMSLGWAEIVRTQRGPNPVKFWKVPSTQNPKPERAMCKMIRRAIL